MFTSIGSTLRQIVGVSVALLLVLAGSLQTRGAARQEFETHALPGDLDPIFGDGGKAVSGLAGRSLVSRALSIQPDGKIIVAGYSSVADLNSKDFVIARHNSDGTLDSSFGDAGFALVDFRGDGDELLAVLLQDDGKLVAVGYTTTCCTLAPVDFAIARLNPNGTPDTGFGIDGEVTTDFSGGVDRAIAARVESDGKILVVGSSSEKVAFARYASNGDLDMSFGEAGKTTVEFASFTTSINAVAFQVDGKVLVAGKAAGSDFVVARYNSDLTRDSSFGKNGVVTTDFFGHDDTAKAISIQPDGKIVAVGEAQRSPITADFGVVRYDSDGRLDKKFGTRGRIGTDFSHGYDGANAVAIDADGRILAAGFAERGSDDFGLARYDASGNLDPDFGVSGVVTTDLSQRKDEANAIALQPDSKIVVAGDVRASDGRSQFGLVRYLAPAPDFQIELSQDTVAVNQGSKATVKVLLKRIGGFKGKVTIMPPLIEPFVKVKLPNPVFGDGDSVTLKLKVKSSATPGIYPMVVVGIDESFKARVATLILVVHQRPAD